jgi:L-ascorbate metabolism protein UlaG (beta-lactamase superfamily)/membrane protein DedA with SNARE-associated domain
VPVEVTWWGHATCTVEDSHIRVLTDPLFTRRLAHLRRRRGALPPPDAWRADVALVSHLHADHLHVPSLARLAPGTRLLVPRGAPRAVPGLRRLRHLRVSEVAPGDVTAVGDLVVRAVPARHDGRRLPFGPHRSPALGYVVEGEARTYFAGDTGLFDEMEKEVGPVDVALLPVGGWGPFLGEGHLDAGRAAEALARLAPGSAVPVHRHARAERAPGGRAVTWLAAASTAVPPETTQQALGYPSLFLLVLIGALVPVVPTGALVSSAAVVAFHQTAPFALALVFVTASLAAFLGDVALYWLGRRGMGSKNGSRWLAAIRARAPEDRLAQAQEKLAGHGVAVLVLSRLVPAGRIPVMLACLMARWPLRRFVRGNLPACLAWTVTYQLIGILGGSLFPEPWEGVAAAVALTVRVSAAPGVWRRLRGTAAR